MKDSTKQGLVAGIDKFFRGHYTPEGEIQKADLLLGFGRNNLGLVSTAASIWSRQTVGNILYTGGLGKDSGPVLKGLKLPEASYLGYMLFTQYGVPLEHIFVEDKATNGGENCRNSIALIRELGLPAASVVLLAYPASLFRLYRMMVTVGRELGFEADYQLLAIPGPESFDNPKDQDEIIAEFLRLIEWPAKGWLDPCELPSDLVEAALATKMK